MESDAIRSFFDEPIRQALLLYYDLMRGIRGAVTDSYDADGVTPKKTFTEDEIKLYLKNLSLGELLALCQRCASVRTGFGKSVSLIIQKFQKERLQMTGLYAMSMLVIIVFGAVYTFMNYTKGKYIWYVVPLTSIYVLAFLIGLFGIFVILAHRVNEIYTKAETKFKVDIDVWKDFGPYWSGTENDNNGGWVQAFTQPVFTGPMSVIQDQIRAKGASTLVYEPAKPTEITVNGGTLGIIAGQIKTYIDRYNTAFLTSGVSASGISDAYTRDRVILEDFFRKLDFWMNKQYQGTVHARDDKAAARDLYAFVMWYDEAAAAKDDDACNTDLAPTEPRRRCTLSESTKLMNLRRRLLTDILRPAVLNEIKTDTETYAYGLVKRQAEILFTRQHLIHGKMEGIAKWMNPLIQRDPAAAPGTKSRVYNNWLQLLRTIHRDFVIAKAMSTDAGDIEPRGGYVQHSTFKRMLRSMDVDEIEAKVKEMRDYIGVSTRLQQRVVADKTIQEKAEYWNLNQQCLWVAYGFGGTSAGVALAYYIQNLYEYEKQKQQTNATKEIAEAKKEASRPAGVARASALGLPGTTVQAMTQAMTTNTAAALASIQPILKMKLEDQPEVRDKRDELIAMMAVMSALRSRMNWAEANLAPDGPTKTARMKQYEAEVTRELAKVPETSAYQSYKDDVTTKDDPMVLRDLYNSLAQDYNRALAEVQSMVRYYGLDTKKEEEKKDDSDFKHISDTDIRTMLKLLNPMLKFHETETGGMDLKYMLTELKDRYDSIYKGVFKLASLYNNVGTDANIALKKEKLQLGKYKPIIEFAYNSVDEDKEVESVPEENGITKEAKTSLKAHIKDVKKALQKKNDSGSSSGNNKKGQNGNTINVPKINTISDEDVLRSIYKKMLRENKLVKDNSQLYKNMREMYKSNNNVFGNITSGLKAILDREERLPDSFFKKKTRGKGYETISIDL